MGNKFWAAPVVTYMGEDSTNYLGVVFSKEQANEVMANWDAAITLVCIDLPRAKLCVSVADAYAFYKEGENGGS